MPFLSQETFLFLLAPLSERILFCFSYPELNFFPPLFFLFNAFFGEGFSPFQPFMVFFPLFSVFFLLIFFPEHKHSNSFPNALGSSPLEKISFSPCYFRV